MDKPASNKELALTFLHLAASGQVQPAYERFVGAKFRHHNPHFPGDAESLKRAMLENATNNPEKTFDVLHALQEGEFVAVHSRVRMNPNHAGVAVVHIFRFEEERIVELWDIGQPVPEGTVNENGMF